MHFTLFSAFYPFFRLLPFFPLFRLLPFFPPFTLFSAFPPFTLFSAFPPFTLFSAFPPFTLFFRFSAFYPFFRFSAFYPFFRFSVFPFPRFTLTPIYRYQNPLYMNKILKNKPYILKRIHPSVTRCYTSRPPTWLGSHNRKLRPGRKNPRKKYPRKNPRF